MASPCPQNQARTQCSSQPFRSTWLWRCCSVGDGNMRGGPRPRSLAVPTSPGLTVARSVVRPRHEENPFVGPAQPLYLSELRLAGGPYQHDPVSGTQQSQGLGEVLLYSLWVHLLWGEGVRVGTW